MDLYAFLQQFRPRITNDVAALVVRDVTAGAFHLHQHGIVHRDLKPENVLVSVGQHNVQVRVCACMYVYCVRAPSPPPSHLPLLFPILTSTTTAPPLYLR